MTKRYDLVPKGCCEIVAKRGDYVRYKDHIEEVDSLKKELFGVGRYVEQLISAPVSSDEHSHAARLLTAWRLKQVNQGIP